MLKESLDDRCVNCGAAGVLRMAIVRGWLCRKCLNLSLEDMDAFIAGLEARQKGS